jgi:hypothetical protein
MSHFSVLVVGSNPEEQLAPFNEDLKVDPYMENCYCIGRRALEEVEKRVASECLVGDESVKTILTNAEDGIFQPVSEVEVVRRKAVFDVYIEKRRQLVDRYLQDHPLKDKPDLKCKECSGSGKRETTYNPNSKWDYYVLGGRWCGFFKLKSGACCPKIVYRGIFKYDPEFDTDVACKGDIDFDGMRVARIEKATKMWDLLAPQLDSKVLLERQEAFAQLFGAGNVLTKDQYIKESAPIATFAVLMDEVWYERGSMKWFGTVSNDKGIGVWEDWFCKTINALPDNTLLSVYDCHI